METIQLNLARKWRSQDFDHIIGQDLSVRMLKNSLYIGQFFPVYLFAGQRGCGKTSTARVFASALNCEKLPNFQKNPKKISIPCLSCPSCRAMQSGKHSDFIEIDAASHTGVDNVRHIIESSSLMPLIGRKKIYLIDEAHMLSKAAFNALLKILEEPPATALFILATTNPDKIIDTVRSRCFQLFFAPVDAKPLVKHLITICKNEKLQYETDALELIVYQTEGSVRDAINLLEQVRFSTKKITKDAVLKVLGHVDDEQLLSLLEVAIFGTSKDLLQYIEATQLSRYSAKFIWDRLIELTRILVWIKHGVTPPQIIQNTKKITRLAKKSSLKQLHDLLELFYKHEMVFAKTTAQHTLIEMMLLQLSYSNDSNGGDSGSSSPLQQHATLPSEDEAEFLDEDEEETEEYEDDEEYEEDEAGEEVYIQQWAVFLQKLDVLKDPLLNSIFKQGKIISFAENTGVLEIEFARDFIFFNDWLEDTKSSWLPLLQECLGEKITLQSRFSGPKKEQTIKKSAIPLHVPQQQKSLSVSPNKTTLHPAKKTLYKRKTSWGNTKRAIEPRIDVSDVVIWKKTNMILQQFPGTVTEVREQNGNA